MEQVRGKSQEQGGLWEAVREWPMGRTGQGSSVPANCGITGLWLPVIFKFRDRLEIQIFT